MLAPSLLTLLFVNFGGSMVIPISHREKNKNDTAAFNRLIVNTSVGAPLTDTA